MQQECSIELKNINKEYIFGTQVLLRVLLAYT